MVITVLVGDGGTEQEIVGLSLSGCEYLLTVQSPGALSGEAEPE